MIDEEKQPGEAQNLSAEAPDLTELSQDFVSVAATVQEGQDASDVSPVPGETDGEVQELEAAVLDSPAPLAELEQTIATLKTQLEERSGQYMRIAADFENFRKRTQKEKEDLELQIKCSTIGELLPVVDNFERARAQLKPQTDVESNIHKSYQSVYKLLVDCLKRVGVSPMRAEGKEFDPVLHEAVMREPTSLHPEGTVMEELVRGYVLGERVLRHALVKVAAPPEPEDSGVETEAS
ncbi:hypothetical protein DO97_21260 [Neosynechococcus sphagnicola sy1]|uniref:Protein GrpE n=1 Tax=Neosynechococcus sphagnicola sy1 TaxID=1497020 RepID=A0A098TLZ4_9CYAN|nr:nucleotide exchange factor GrpE [Neosynechococcus sphagnicola]KGF73335.1 hypothetical protein DO97_21260 [Neosynechococcus sphagnicola sy1]